MKRCGYCNQEYDEQDNHDRACRYHPEFYFPYDIDKDGNHQKGWQCCGDEEVRAPGCVFSRHRDDVRQQYRPGSIAYDYVVLAPKGDSSAD